MLGFNRRDGDSGGSLLVDEVTQASLTLDDHVRDAHLDAQGRKPDNQFNRVDIVSNDNQLSLLGFNKGGDVAQTKFDNLRGLRVDGLVLGLGSGSSLKTFLLLGNSLRAITGQKTEQSGSARLIKSFGELVNARRDLQALLEDGLLTLEADVLRPLHIAGQITRWLDGAADLEVTRLGRKQVSMR